MGESFKKNIDSFKFKISKAGMRQIHGKADAMQNLPSYAKTVPSSDQFLVRSPNISKLYCTCKHLAHSSVAVKQKFCQHMERRLLKFQKLKSRKVSITEPGTLILEKKLH